MPIILAKEPNATMICQVHIVLGLPPKKFFRVCPKSNSYKYSLTDPILAKPLGPIYFMITQSAPHRGRLGQPELSPSVLQMAGIHLSEQTTDAAGLLHNSPTLHTFLPNNKGSISTTGTHASSGSPKEPPKMFQKCSFIRLPKSLHIHVSQGLSECVHLKTTPPHQHSPCPAHEACT